MEFVKWKIEHKDSIFGASFILQNAKLRILEVHYNFFDKYYDVTKFEELEMDTEPPYLALSEHDWHGCIRQAMNKSGTLCEVETVRMNCQPTQQQMSSLVLAALSIRSTIDENLGYSKKNTAAQKRFVCVAKRIAIMTNNQTNSNLAAKAWKK